MKTQSDIKSNHNACFLEKLAIIILIQQNLYEFVNLLKVRPNTFCQENSPFLLRFLIHLYLGNVKCRILS